MCFFTFVTGCSVYSITSTKLTFFFGINSYFGWDYWVYDDSNSKVLNSGIFKLLWIVSFNNSFFLKLFFTILILLIRPSSEQYY